MVHVRSSLSSSIIALFLSALHSVKLVDPALWIRQWSWLSWVKSLWPSDLALADLFVFLDDSRNFR